MAQRSQMQNQQMPPGVLQIEKGVQHQVASTNFLLHMNNPMGISRSLVQPINNPNANGAVQRKIGVDYDDPQGANLQQPGLVAAGPPGPPLDSS